MKLPPFEVGYFALILALTGYFCCCATETRDLGLGGMHTSETGTLAIGSAADPSAGSRRGDLGPDTIVYTKAQADQVFMKRGEAVDPPAYVVVTNTATVKYVYGTNVVPVPNGATLVADLSGWVEGQTVFTKIVPAGTYAVATTITLAGYGTWPTAPFDCVAWKSGGKVYITVLREEE